VEAAAARAERAEARLATVQKEARAAQARAVVEAIQQVSAECEEELVAALEAARAEREAAVAALRREGVEQQAGALLEVQYRRLRGRRRPLARLGLIKAV
jgi:hypothetical protein